MFADSLLMYNMRAGVEAFSTMRNASLPYPVMMGHQDSADRILVVEKPEYERDKVRGYDAFVTRLHGVAIGVRSADCVPILLYDPEHEAIAAVHAGWRGTLLKISAKCIKLMSELYGTRGIDLIAQIGPCISFESFQVGEELVKRFAEEGFDMEHFAQNMGERAANMQGGWHIDLVAINKAMLQECGVLTENIGVTNICSYKDSRFFSARREGGEGCGRTISAIKMK